MLAGGCVLLTSAACAQTWHFIPGARLEETLTDNVNLAPSDRAKADLVTEITPELAVVEKGARTSLEGSVRVPLLIYARTGATNNKAYPEADLTGTVEAIERFLYVDGGASVRQTFFSPFGAQPSGISNATANRFRADTYRVSPYIKSFAGRDITYELRDDNIWTHLSGAPTSSHDSYTNHVTGNLTRHPEPVGWSAEIDRNSDKFQGQPQALVTQLVRAKLLVQANPDLRLNASGGYEDNHYTFIQPHGAIYGGGVEWRPSPRTKLKGQWEHRFFGSSYDFSFDNRTPLTTWDLRAARNITSYPQQLASLPASGDVAATLDQLFLSRIPDPAERQVAVNNIIASAGLPASLSSPLTIYTEQIYLQETASATAGILGARNNLIGTVYRTRTEPIEGTGTPLPPELLAQTNNTQKGVNLVWSHTLDRMVNFTVNGSLRKTVANAPFEGSSTERSIIAGLISRLSPSLTAFAGMRYQTLHSDLVTSYNELAVFAGVNYRCCGRSSQAAAGAPSFSGY
jgi:uncharacterized protein (PEP-CTERM system associated)